MNYVLVRFSEIGTKSDSVQRQMLSLLRDRVAERLTYEGIDASVERRRGRIVVEVAADAAEALAEVPGVASTSPAVRADAEIDAIAAATDELAVESPFAVDANVAGDAPLSSRRVNEEVGAHVVERTGAEVDLDDPATRIEVDVRKSDAFVFTRRFAGPGGYPVGTQRPLAALVSGGIDSPVAAHEVLTRGADVVPVYFYNRPYAAEDHVFRFEAALSRLRRFHPAKDWYYHRVDMGPVNERLRAVESGRMVLHRAVLFRVADRIAADEDLAGLVTGEAIGQKSSQTVANLAVTARGVERPVHRPLLTDTKESITRRAKELGTFEEATIDSACRTIAPDSPATELDPDRFEALADEVPLDALVETAFETAERVDL